MVAVTRYRYVVTEDDILGSEPSVEGTRTPVGAIVETWRRGVAPEEIPSRLPHLGLAQVFEGLSEYLDHQDAINTHIERNHIPDELVAAYIR